MNEIETNYISKTGKRDIASNFETIKKITFSNLKQEFQEIKTIYKLNKS